MKKLLWLFVCGFATTTSAQFNDVEDYLYAESVNYLAEQNVVQGYNNGTFKPNQTINRAEFTKIVMASVFDITANDAANCFSDINTNAWYAPYICAAKNEGIINGYPDGSFKPTQNVNQAEALKILYETFYEDVETTDGEWYQSYLDAAEYDGMLYFEPENPANLNITRGQMAYFAAWFLDENGELRDEISFDDFYGEDFNDTNFGWENMTADDCFEDEYFDEDDQQCYLLEDDFSDDEDLWYDLHGNDEAFEPHGETPETNEISESVTYAINGDTITLINDESVAGTTLNNKIKHQEIWNRFKQLIPPKQRTRFVELVLYEDAEDSTAAYVENQTEALEQWVMGVNLGDLYDEEGLLFDSKEFDLTLIHEFAHVLTLNARQIDPTIEIDDCYPNFHTGEGCAKPASFINQFVKKFWDSQDLKIAQENPETLYNKKPNSFITDYAATNPGEDIAESFAYFVAKAKPQNCTAKIRDAKLCFMFDQPQLLSLRNYIRKALSQ